MRRLKPREGKLLSSSHTVNNKRVQCPQPLFTPWYSLPLPSKKKKQAESERKASADWKGRPCTLTYEDASGVTVMLFMASDDPSLLLC